MPKLKTPEYVKEIAFLNGDPDRISDKTCGQIAKRVAERLQSPDPEVSIVIIAYNEEENLIPTIASLSEIDSPFKTELIVVNNNSTDRTQEVLNRCGVTSVFEERQGIGWARQAGLEAAKAPIVVNGDADSIYPPGWSTAMAEPLLSTDAAVVYSRYSFIPENPANTVYLRVHEWLAATVFRLRRKQADTSNVMGFSFAFRKQDAMKVGGFPVDGRHRWEDGLLVKKLHQLGDIHLVSSDDARVWTSDRRLLMDGNYMKAFLTRAKKHMRYMPDYLSFKKAQL